MPDASLEQYRQEINERGYTVIPDVLSQAQCVEMGQALDKIYARLGGDSVVYQDYDSSQEHLIYNVHNKDPRFVSLLDHARVLPLLQGLLGEDVVLNYYNARSTRNGCKPQRLHFDSRVRSTSEAVMAQVIWMIDDFTEANGATRVVPGSHRFVDPPETDRVYPEEVCITGNAGSVLMYHSALWHAASASTSDARRWGVIATYGRWYMKPSMDFTKNTPPDVYASLTPMQKQLLGFNSIPPHDERIRTHTIVPLSELPSEWKER